MGAQSAVPEAGSPAWAVGLLRIGAGLGVALSAVSTWVHHQATTRQGYTSFCDFGEGFDCERVVTSEYGYLFGVPVSIWGLGFYALLVAVSIAAGSAAPGARESARRNALTLSIGGALFSVYLAAVSFGVLGNLCLICASLYVVSALCLVAAGAAVGDLADWRDHVIGQVSYFFERPLLGAAAGLTIGALFLLPGWLGGGSLPTTRDLAENDPKFYDWYISHPIVRVPGGGIEVAGAADAPLTIVEFADFQCGACAEAHERMKEVLANYGEHIRFIFRNFPLSNQCNEDIPADYHSEACIAAKATICASKSGHFKAYSGEVFTHRRALSEENLVEFAKQLGLEEAPFRACLSAAETEAALQADIDAGRKVNIQRTPTFLLNGRKVEGVMTPEYWRNAIGLELDPQKG